MCLRLELSTACHSQSSLLGVVQKEDAQSLPDPGSVASKHGNRAARATAPSAHRRLSGTEVRGSGWTAARAAVAVVGAGGLVSGSGLEGRNASTWRNERALGTVCPRRSGPSAVRPYRLSAQNGSAGRAALTAEPGCCFLKSDPGCPGQGWGLQMADLEVGGPGPGQGRPESGCLRAPCRG